MIEDNWEVGEYRGDVLKLKSWGFYELFKRFRDELPHDLVEPHIVEHVELLALAIGHTEVVGPSLARHPELRRQVLDVKTLMGAIYRAQDRALKKYAAELKIRAKQADPKVTVEMLGALVLVDATYVTLSARAEACEAFYEYVAGLMAVVQDRRDTLLERSTRERQDLKEGSDNH